MVKFVKTFAVFALAFLIFGAAQTASAQNMSGSVVTKQVKFAKGKSSAVLKESAKYAMSYIYEIRVRKGQTATLNLAGKNSELSFSLIAPDEETVEDAFGVTDWAGKLAQSGKYTIVVVMNDENAKTAVPFTLKVEVK